MSETIRVTVWNEYRHEKMHEAVHKVYPDGIHGAIAAFIGKEADMTVRTAVLDDPDNGLPEEVLAETDVLMWWGHMAHGEVDDATVDRVQKRVLEGMGLVVLHSGHLSKPFVRLMGTSCTLKWREEGEKHRLWTVERSHPIVQGVGEYFELPHTEMYGERFDIPRPDELIFISWFEGGEVFRSGCTWRRGNGKVFYFQPGHETFPIYYDANVQTVLRNAVRWAKPLVNIEYGCPNPAPLEELRGSDSFTKVGDLDKKGEA